MKLKPIFDKETLEPGRKLFCEPCTFVLGAAELHQLPDGNMPEVAFIGRSNVGKSSLINALFHRNNLAKTSSTPGRTQQLNYFNLNNKLYLVDLPGYGFAKAPTNVVKKWHEVIFTYLQGRPNLRKVFLLADSNLGIKKSDSEMMDMLDKAAVPYQVIFTKCDRISNKELYETMDEVALLLKKHAAAHNVIIYTSASKKIGLENVRAEIANLL
ncbi:MAG: ribosome biogenesis GTP-binding protein YihA/YsxC [Alphaproteobacteria bacterium]|nr:ribosome biogenesis GTP-binding protein YihA/YsxC [Alphaproteobacteria bacterium]